MLPRVSRGYLLCRAADTLEDAWPGSAAEIGERFDLFEAALGGDGAAVADLGRRAAQVQSGRSEFELLANLGRVLRVHAALAAPDREAIETCVQTLASGMRRYATRAAARAGSAPYLDDEPELHDYCWVVAGCVGVMLTRLFAMRAPAPDPALEQRRLALAPVVGEALQLTNILLDWPVDVRRGRCFVPRAWLDEWGLEPAGLDPGARGARARARLPRPDPGAPPARAAVLPVAGAVGGGLVASRAPRPRVPVGTATPEAVARRAVGRRPRVAAGRPRCAGDAAPLRPAGLKPDRRRRR